MPTSKTTAWYVTGLHFECRQCGRCCSGPNQGYIWVTRPEIKFIADFLKASARQVRQKFLRRVGLRATIIEQGGNKDCVFLREIDGRKRCMIYPVRPNQCRTWPFWEGNLKSPDDWNKAAQKCSGINHGTFYSFEEIEKIRKSKKWWPQNKQTNNRLLETVAEIYNWLDSQTRHYQSLPGGCRACGECCDFAKFDHRLFVTPPELIYLAENLNGEKIKPMTTGRCPYNVKGKCSVYEYRFAACRIFYCRADEDFQSSLSESVLKKFKSVCEDFRIPYRYTDLPSALNNFAG